MPLFVLFILTEKVWFFIGLQTTTQQQQQQQHNYPLFNLELKIYDSKSIPRSYRFR